MNPIASSAIHSLAKRYRTLEFPKEIICDLLIQVKRLKSVKSNTPFGKLKMMKRKYLLSKLRSGLQKTIHKITKLVEPYNLLNTRPTPAPADPWKNTKDRQPALPLARRRILPEVRDNQEGVSPVPPLPLSQSVGMLESHL
jgi:hypothetical protein